MLDEPKSYIAYLDMLGTQGFCGSPDVYYEKITDFYQELQQCSIFLEKEGKAGKVGFFSDSAYIESSDLECMVIFLERFRNRLCSKGLFFNGALQTGKLGIIDPREKNKDLPLFGVVFTNNNLAKVYVEQNKFKGIGIHLSDEVVFDMSASGLSDHIVDSIYLPEPNSKPVEYKDLKVELSFDGFRRYEQCFLVKVINACLLAYSSSQKYGRYYISLLACVVNSSNCNYIEWDHDKHRFLNAPLIFNAILDLAKGDADIPKVAGIEYLCLLVVYKAYEKLSDIDKQDLTEAVHKLPIFSIKYANDLEQIPKLLDKNDTREQFITLYQKYLVQISYEKVFGSNNNIGPSRNDTIGS
jgi:hypothetical protein